MWKAQEVLQEVNDEKETILGVDHLNWNDKLKD